MTIEELFNNKIGVIGAGHIGQALILKLLEKGYPYDNMELTYNGSIFTFSDLYDNNLVDMIGSNASIVENSDIIILSVPPQSFSKIGEFNLDSDVLVISFMAGISIDTIKKQTGSDNIVKVIPTGPSTIRDSRAIAGFYPENKVAMELFDLLDFDCYSLDCEDDMDYISVAGCLPAVFCRVDYELDETRRDIERFSTDFPDFVEIARKTSQLVPDNNKDEFVESFSTKGGVTEAIINAIDNGDSLYDSLRAGLERARSLNM
ncbi:MAG: NAD(P)-binding domain-containing protein [Methanosphaera sp.]|nr:NAD(P)-binding domain-containing protein [Methanosphaera sp.]